MYRVEVYDTPPVRRLLGEAAGEEELFDLLRNYLVSDHGQPLVGWSVKITKVEVEL